MLDNEFLERLLGATTDEEIKKLLKEKGLDFSDEQIAELKERFVSKFKDEMLSNVSGGKKDIRRGAFEGTYIGAAVGAGVGLFAGLAMGCLDATTAKSVSTVGEGALLCLRDTLATMAVVAPISAGMGAGFGAGASALWGKEM